MAVKVFAETLCPDVLIITFEFDRWSSAAGPQRDRLDVLGLGRDGRLVVAELKRGRAPDTVELQAIKYAAMASRFTEELLAELHATRPAEQPQKGRTVRPFDPAANRRHFGWAGSNVWAERFGAPLF
jgi:hypothetical protein